MISKIFKSLSLVLLVNCIGCLSTYPKMLDNPEFQKAAIDVMKDSNKTYELGSGFHNPEIEFYYKMSFGARAIGVEGEAGIKGAGGPQEKETPTTLNNQQPNEPIGLLDRRKGINAV